MQNSFLTLDKKYFGQKKKNENGTQSYKIILVFVQVGVLFFWRKIFSYKELFKLFVTENV